MYFKEKYLKYKQKYLNLKLQKIGGNNIGLNSSDNVNLKINDCFQIIAENNNVFKDPNNNPIIFKITNILDITKQNCYKVFLQGWKTSALIHKFKDTGEMILILDFLKIDNSIPITSSMIKKIDCPQKFFDWEEYNRKNNLNKVADLVSNTFTGTKSKRVIDCPE